ncbi:MAG: GNAT family N-acetyltransferase [Thalassobaculales bacterium]
MLWPMDDLHRPPLTLAAILPEQAELLAAWRREPSSLANNPVLPLSPAELRDQIRRLARDLPALDPAGYRWVVFCAGEPIGSISLKTISRQMLYGEIGYHIGEAFQGRGLGSLAVALAVDTIFRETRLHRLFAHVAAFNQRSQRLLRRLGFRQEGVLRQHYVIADRRVDQVVLGLLRPEWEAARGIVKPLSFDQFL